MNPRSRDARRLRVVRRLPTLIMPSIRLFSNFNDDTSSVRCGSRPVLLPLPPPPRQQARLRERLLCISMKDSDFTAVSSLASNGQLRFADQTIHEENKLLSTQTCYILAMKLRRYAKLVQDATVAHGVTHPEAGHEEVYPCSCGTEPCAVLGKGEGVLPAFYDFPNAKWKYGISEWCVGRREYLD